MENELEKYVTTVDFEVDDDYDSESFLKLKLKLAHTGVCPKGFDFTKESLENAAPTIINKPILARVVFDSENNPQFSSHDKHIEKDYKNEVRIVYDEVPIGIIPKDNEYVVEYDEETKNYYSYCIGYIWKKYSNYALDIIERDKKVKLSIEIFINKFEVDKETKAKKVTDFKYDGATLLGNNRNPGMKNASASTEFELDSERINLDKQDYLNEFLEEFKKVLAEFDNSKEGGETILKEKEVKETVDTKDAVVEDEQPKGEEFEKDTKETHERVEDTKPTEPKKDEKEENFELTANETRENLCKALDKLERKTDTYFYLMDYDSKYIYYVEEVYTEDDGWVNTRYRRSYTLVDNEVTLGDDVVETVVKILTKDEWDALEKSREEQEVEFENLKTFKETTLKEQREKALEEVFDKFDQKLIDVEAYQQLKENNAEFSIEDVENKCFAICGRLEFDKELVVEQKEEFVKAGVEETFEDDREEDSKEDDVYSDLKRYY